MFLRIPTLAIHYLESDSAVDSSSLIQDALAKLLSEFNNAAAAIRSFL